MKPRSWRRVGKTFLRPQEGKWPAFVLEFLWVNSEGFLYLGICIKSETAGKRIEAKMF